jgi:hypothetical protein
MSSLSMAVQSRAAQALRQSSHPALRTLSVQENGETIVIFGKVTSYYLKQLAQETIMPVRGGLELINRVTVIKD